MHLLLSALNRGDALSGIHDRLLAFASQVGGEITALQAVLQVLEVQPQPSCTSSTDLTRHQMQATLQLFQL